MRVIAEFKGADGSCGFKKGAPYVLKFTITGGLFLAVSGDLWCTYSSLSAFLNNWEVLA